MEEKMMMPSSPVSSMVNGCSLSGIIPLLTLIFSCFISSSYAGIPQLCPCTFPPYHNLNKPQARHYDEKVHLLPSTSIRICVHEKYQQKLQSYIHQSSDIPRMEGITRPGMGMGMGMEGDGNEQGQEGSSKGSSSSGSSKHGEDHFIFYHDETSFHDKMNRHKCHVVLVMTSNSVQTATIDERRMCPMGCDVDIPTLHLPFFVLDIDPAMPLETIPRYALTCSLTLHEHVLPKWQLISSLDRHSHILHSFPRFVIHEAVTRQYYECLETASLIKYGSPSYTHLQPPVPDSAILATTGEGGGVSGGGVLKKSKALRARVNKVNRRKVQAMAIWIGTIDRLSMSHNQANSLYSSIHDMKSKPPLKAQDKVIASSFHEEQAIVPWIATELLYPCHPDKINCKAGGMKRYGGLLPGSAVNYMPPGWGCAQRRPLRALSHTLLFFDPDYVILLDDDTYFNYPLFFTSSYYHFVMQNMTKEPIYLGEALGRTGENGHLSTIGFFIGGSGYIIGKTVLSRLSSREIVSFGTEHIPVHRDKYYLEENVHTNANPSQFLHEDRFRTRKHIEKLGVLQEALEYATWHCPKVNVTTILPSYRYEEYLYKSVFFHWDRDDFGHRINTDACLLYHPALRKAFDDLQKKTTVPLIEDSSSTGSSISAKIPSTPAYALPEGSVTRQLTTIPISVRLVDLCANLMANEHTCQHSDHSIGRCLIYGAGATPLMTACENQVRKKNHDGQGKKMNSDSSADNADVVKYGSDHLLFGMCFTAPECNEDEHITCHRYQANDTTLKPSRTSTSAGYYKKFSSFYDGKIVDTQL